MKIVGLITEYNPFHNGHKYHIEEALRVTGSNAALVIMSGDFVQRGAPALLPKHLRAEMALKSGASVVIELPVAFATGSAEYFAWGAVSLLDALGCISSLCFGSECGDLARLTKIAQILADEPSEYKKMLQSYLKTGLSFPLARQRALADYTADDQLSQILTSPNNTLGIEYIKALLKRGSKMQPYTITRIQSDYHDKDLQTSYSSATAIRNVFSKEEHPFEQLASQIPAEALPILEKNYGIRFPINANDFSLLLRYKLLTETKEHLLSYADMTEELANRIMNQRNQLISWNGFCESLKTKELTYSRISRVLLHILLGITEKQMEEFKACPVSYARLLGFSARGREVLTALKESSSIPLISKLPKNVNSDLASDLFASDLYESVVTDKFGTTFINEYQKQIVRI